MVIFQFGKICATLLPPHPPCRNPQQGFIFSRRVNFTDSAALFHGFFSCKQDVGQKKSGLELFMTCFISPQTVSRRFNLHLQLLEGFLRKVGFAVCLHQTKVAKNKQLKPTDKKPFENVFSLRHNMNDFSGLFQLQSSV